MFFFLGKIWPHNRLADPFLDQPLIWGADTKCSYLKHTGGWLRQTVHQCDRYESGSPRGCTQRYRWRSPASCTSDFRFSAHYWRIQDQRKWSLKVQQHGIIGLKFYFNSLGILQKSKLISKCYGKLNGTYDCRLVGCPMFHSVGSVSLHLRGNKSCTCTSRSCPPGIQGW